MAQACFFIKIISKELLTQIKITSDL